MTTIDSVWRTRGFSQCISASVTTGYSAQTNKNTRFIEIKYVEMDRSGGNFKKKIEETASQIRVVDERNELSRHVVDVYWIESFITEDGLREGLEVVESLRETSVSRLAPCSLLATFLFHWNYLLFPFCSLISFSFFLYLSYICQGSLFGCPLFKQNKCPSHPSFVTWTTHFSSVSSPF